MSQFIFKDSALKARLVNKALNFYVGEYKTDKMEAWFPYICGTGEGLCLTQQDKDWAIK